MECIDNDETASAISTFVHAKYLLIYTSADGIYAGPNDPPTLVERVEGKNADELIAAIEELQKHCVGASRSGAGGVKMKLEFLKEPARQGTTVIVASPHYRITEVLAGDCRRTIFQIR